MRDATNVNPDIRGKRRPDNVIGELAAAQHGVVARRQLAELGLARRAIEHRIEAGRLHPVHRGVYAVGHPILSLKGRWMAAVLASGPDAVLSHRSAAHLWDLRPSSRTRIEVVVPQWIRPRAGIQAHASCLDPDEITVRDAIPVTTSARTIQDLAKVLPERVLERVLEQAEIRRLEVRPGNPTLTRLLRASRSNPTQSELEEAFISFLTRNGLPQPQRNVKVLTDDGWITVDAMWRDRGLILELDGYETHGTRAAFERDRARDRALMAEGWRVIRLTWRQLKDERTGRQIRRLLDVH
jgi:very-short-patch-repair endonuclease